MAIYRHNQTAQNHKALTIWAILYGAFDCHSKKSLMTIYLTVTSIRLNQTSLHFIDRIPLQQKTTLDSIDSRTIQVDEPYKL